MILLRIYLLAGLITHKVIWEVLKKRRVGEGIPHRPALTLPLAFVKAAKIGALAGVMLQTMLPELLPLTTNALVLRILGTVMYSVGALTAIFGRIQLGGNWSDIEAAQVSWTQAVVSKGLYRYIKHPIYVGDLLLLLGLELALNSWLVVAVFFLVPVVLTKALAEEEMLVRALPGYDVYSASTKRFIPFIY